MRQTIRLEVGVGWQLRGREVGGIEKQGINVRILLQKSLRHNGDELITSPLMGMEDC